MSARHWASMAIQRVKDALAGDGETEIERVANGIYAQVAAEEALAPLTDVQKVHFAMRLIVNTTDPEACRAIHFASQHIEMHARALGRAALAEEFC